jgi:hypothetical protein
MRNKSNSYTLTHRHTRPPCRKADRTLSNCRAPFNPPPPTGATPPPSQRPRHPPDLPLAPPNFGSCFHWDANWSAIFYFIFQQNPPLLFFQTIYNFKNRMLLLPLFWRHFLQCRTLERQLPSSNLIFLHIIGGVIMCQGSRPPRRGQTTRR